MRNPAKCIECRSMSDGIAVAAKNFSFAECIRLRSPSVRPCEALRSGRNFVAYGRRPRKTCVRDRHICFTCFLRQCAFGHLACHFLARKPYVLIVSGRTPRKPDSFRMGNTQQNPHRGTLRLRALPRAATLLTLPCTTPRSPGRGRVTGGSRQRTGQRSFFTLHV